MDANSVAPSSSHKPRPHLLASIPIPISSCRRPPVPPPSSPIRYHHSSTEDGLLFAMSPDQNTLPTPFISRTFSSSEQRKPSSVFMQKYLNDLSIPRPFLSTRPDPYSDEPFMYSVPRVKPASRPQTPKNKISNFSATAVTTPTARRHALLRANAPSTRPPRSSATYSSSQTSEDESDFFPGHKARPSTSAFRRSISTNTSATTSTASSSASSSLDALLTTTASSYPFRLSDDVAAMPVLSPLKFCDSPFEEKLKVGRSSVAGIGLLDRIKSVWPSPSPSPHQDEKRQNHGKGIGEISKIPVTSSLGVEKYFREVVGRGVGGEGMTESKLTVEIVQVSRGRPKERRTSRGTDAGVPVLAEKYL